MNHSAHSPGAPALPEHDLEEVFDEQDTQQLIEALCQLRETKQQALGQLRAEGWRPGAREFEPRDFGIPQIDGLLKPLGVEPFSPQAQTEEH